MQVMKIGGAVLKSPQGFSAMLDILKSAGAEPFAVVISAFSKSTYLLREAAFTAEDGLESKSYKILEGVIEENTGFYRTILKKEEHLQKLDSFFKKSSGEIRSLLKGISITREVTPRTLDLILSFGEYFALKIVSQYLSEQNFNFTMINAADVIVTDSRFGRAVPLPENTKKNVQKIILPELKKNKFVLTQGFVARTESGDISTMGIESSNLTAALLANMLDAEKLIVWTDVEGFRSADPKIVSGTHHVPYLDYKTSRFLSMNGMKLLYPSMLGYLEEKGIRLIYKSAYDRKGDSTEINLEAPEVFVSMIISKGGMYYTKFEDTREPDTGSVLLETARNNSIFFFSLSKTGFSLLTQRKTSLPDKYKAEYKDNYAMITCLNLELKQDLSNLHNKNKALEIHSEYCSCGKVLRILCPEEEVENIIRILHGLV